MGALRYLDRDQVRAEIGDRLHPHWTEQEVVEADDADSLQQIEHAFQIDEAVRHRDQVRMQRQREHAGLGLEFPIEQAERVHQTVVHLG